MQRLPLPFLCPACGVRQPVVNRAALACLGREGLCQGCRAGRSLAGRPELLRLFVGFWKKTRFPASASWLDAVLSPLAEARSVPPAEAEAAMGAPH